MNMFRKNRKGFTLIELIIVIAILAILAAIAIPTFAGIIERANNTVNQANGSQIATAYNSYNALNPNHQLPATKGSGATASVGALETAIGVSLWPRGLTATQAAAAWPWVTITDGVAGVLPIDTPPAST
jgi:prepilin-type N-terminal cleavage/methylation domain-containing protein